MQGKEKKLFTHRDLIAILLLLACLAIGCVLIFVQKASKKNPPVLDLETVKQTAAQSAEYDRTYGGNISREGLQVNINTAGRDSLELLPGIGPAFAERIISYRNQNGPFQDLGQLTDIDGIGLQTLDKIRDFITLE